MYRISNIIINGTQTEIVEIDFHGLEIYEVKSELCTQLEGWYSSGYTIFRIIHGYKHGHEIKEYLTRSALKDLQNWYPKLQIKIIPENSGCTIIFISRK